MADANEPVPGLTTNQISTTNFEDRPVTTTDAHTAAVEPAPSGTVPGTEPGAGTAVSENTIEGVGTDGEVLVWEGRYSMKNFLGRLLGWGMATIGWIALAIYTWVLHESPTGATMLAIVSGLILVAVWINLCYRILLARYGHFYRLTNRRLFISTGLYRRRRDMTELMKIDDVYTRQTLAQRFLSLGTVVVVSSDPKLPMSYLSGVDDPKGVMDTVWHYARSERDRKTIKVDHI